MKDDLTVVIIFSINCFVCIMLKELLKNAPRFAKAQSDVKKCLQRASSVQPTVQNPITPHL